MATRISILFCLLFILGCNKDIRSFDRNIRMLRDSIGETHIRVLKNLNFDDVLSYNKIDSITLAYYYANEEEYFISFFSSLGVADNIDYRLNFLKLALYNDIVRGGKSVYQLIVNLDESRNDEYQKLQIEFEENRLISKDIMFANLERVNIGDSVDIVLPYDRQSGLRKIFTKLGYPYSLSYYPYDSVLITGIVLDEYLYDGSSKSDPDYILKTKIISLDRDSIYSGNKRLDKGVFFDLSLKSYGRYLK